VVTSRRLSRRLSRNAPSAAPPKARAARIFRVEFNQLRADVNITRRITPHDLRRTTATAMYRATRDVREVQALLTHKRLNSTIWYLDHNLTPVSRPTLELIKRPPAAESEDRTA
jgi:integrase